MIFSEADRHYMKLALQEAQKAYDADEVPVGAVVVLKDTLLGRGHNQVELLHDATAHAEIVAMSAAFQYLGSRYLTGATLYVTLEPCLMCAGALYWSQVGRIVYGAGDEKNGYRCFCTRSPFHPKAEVVAGLMQADAARLMQEFFRQKRK